MSARRMLTVVALLAAGCGGADGALTPGDAAASEGGAPDAFGDDGALADGHDVDARSDVRDAPDGDVAKPPNGLAGPPAAGKVSVQPGQTFRGWGMSLAWEANDLYGSGLIASKVPDPVQQARTLDLLFGDPGARLTLGLTAARYNIGGGENPDTHHWKGSSTIHMRGDAQMEGYLDGPGLAYDWSRDANQRRMLHEAVSRGVDVLEAFANSPPYWMTDSQCASGALTGATDNLPAKNYGAFADYLVTVVDHFAKVEGITFESLEPFNEPDGGWWVAGGSQEGLFAAEKTQNALLPMVADRLSKAGLTTFVSGTDANDYDHMTGLLGAFDATALAALGRVNVHQYNGKAPGALHAAVAKLKKPLWMSEVGCCFGGQGDGSEMWGALWMSDAARVGLRDLGAEVWALWQPDWNVLAFAGGTPRPMKQFYALAQSTNFVRAGYQVIWSGADDTLAAYSAKDGRLVLVVTAWTSKGLDLDLGAFRGLPATAATHRTTDDPSVNLAKGSVALTAKGHLVDTLPARSITTYVIDGV